MSVSLLSSNQTQFVDQTQKTEPWDFDAPLWNLCTFMGRLKYYSWIGDPRLSFVSKEKFERAKRLRTLYLLGRAPEKVTERQRLFAKRLYENGYHPDNEDYMNALGRMSFFGLGVALTALPLFLIKNPYRATPVLCACMGVHQCYNQLVNTTNRNATTPLTNGQMAIQLVTAAAAATGAALLTRNYLMREGSHSVQKYVPLASLAAAMMVGIPIMRCNEIFSGISVYDEQGLEVAKSKIAAMKGISEVVLSRLIMIAPPIILFPFLMKRVRTICWVRKNSWSLWPLSALALGGLLLPMVPVSCAIFPQRGSISTSVMEKFERKEFNKIDEFCRGNVPEEVYFNKGL